MGESQDEEVLGAEPAELAEPVAGQLVALLEAEAQAALLAGPPEQESLEEQEPAEHAGYDALPL